jgi:hypothetical protein
LTSENGTGHTRVHHRQINISSVQKEFVSDCHKQKKEFETRHFLKRSASLPFSLHQVFNERIEKTIRAEMGTQTDESCLNEAPKAIPSDKPQRPTSLFQPNHVKILLKHQLTRDSGIDGDQMQQNFKSTETIPELKPSSSQNATRTSERSKGYQARQSKLIISSTRDNSIDQEYANESTSSDLNESLLAEDIMVNLFNRNVLDDDEEDQEGYDHLKGRSTQDRMNSSSANEDDDDSRSTRGLMRNTKAKKIQQRSFEVVSNKRQMFKGTFLTQFFSFKRFTA